MIEKKLPNSFYPYVLVSGWIWGVLTKSSCYKSYSDLYNEKIVSSPTTNEPQNLTNVINDIVQIIRNVNPNFNRVEVGKILSKKCENTLIIMKQENKKTKSPLPNYVRGTIKNNIFLKKKVRKRVNFPDKCMILVIEIESFKKYNYLNTNRDWLKKKSPSLKCNIY